MASGTEMLLINMLKAFMPKEAAEKIYRMVEDGTFDRIGEVPQKLVAIESGIAELRREIAAIRSEQSEGRDTLSHVTFNAGPDQSAFAEHGSGAIARPANPEGTSGAVDAKYNGHSSGQRGAETSS